MIVALIVCPLLLGVAHWRKEYAHMAKQHGRELRRLIALSDLFTDWLVEQGYNAIDAAEIVAELYAKATKEADKK